MAHLLGSAILLSLLFATGAAAARGQWPVAAHKPEAQAKVSAAAFAGASGLWGATDHCLLGILLFLAPADDDPGNFPVVIGDDARLLAGLGELAVRAQEQLG